MSQFLSPDSYGSHSATYKERASVYISDGLTTNDREAAIDMANSFADADRPVSKTTVLIPVAAHQDGEYIVPTLAQYAQQKTEEPFTVFLHLNAPLDAADTTRIEDAEVAIDRARELFPELDIRSSTTLYDSAPIGRIRRDLWNAAFLLSYHEHGFATGDVIGINNDIDTHSISPHYIARIQHHYNRQALARQHLGGTVAHNAVQGPATTRVTHAVSPSHPNTGKVTAWIDNSFFQAPGHIGYEAGLVVPFSNYAQLGGFDETSKTHETSWIHSNGIVSLPYISGAQLYTSPRRYIDRLQKHSAQEIWTEDSFGANDACRDTLPRDITSERAEEIIFDRLNEDILFRWLPGAMRPIYEDVGQKFALGEDIDIAETLSLADSTAEKQLAKAERLLRRMVGSALLADILRESYDSKSFTKPLQWFLAERLKS